MTRVAIYARYSSDRQNERSIADQIGILTEIAGRRGWTVVGSFMDAAISGQAMANRPGLLNALAAAERGEFEALLVEDEDRIARDEEHQWHVYNRLGTAGVFLSTLAAEKVSRMQVAFKSFMAAEYVQVLSQKTKRGMASNAEQGLATGSRLYGYRSQPGGLVEIVPEQAEVIRRIFRNYVDDRMTSREIAAQLNRDGIPSPAGRTWNASTIHGSRQRANGILHTEIYAGTKVYNRVEMRKDRLTGKRVTICNPPSEHKRIPVPHLRIIDQDLWDRAQARKTANTHGDLATRKKPARRPFLLSGLVFCGRCGGGYTAQGGNRLACANYREKGGSVCGNRRHVNRRELETRVLSGLRDRLLDPEAVETYVRAYHAAWEAAQNEARGRKQPVERRLAEIERAIKRGVDAIMSGAGDVSAISDRLRELEGEKAELVRSLEQIDSSSPAVLRLHPRVGEVWVKRVELVQARLALGDGLTIDEDREMIEHLRDLIHRIDVTPESNETRAPYRVTLHGDLARLLRQTAPQVGGPMVAGGGLEPPTCGL